MDRRTLLSGLLATGLAGCSGVVRDAVECDDESATPHRWDVPGKLVESSVDGLTVTDHEAVSQCSGIDRPFGVTVTVVNSGDRQIETLTDYEFALTLFAGDGTEITPRLTTTHTTDGDLDPGDRSELVIARGRWEGDTAPEDVVRYELSLSCDRSEDTTYCQP